MRIRILLGLGFLFGALCSVDSFAVFIPESLEKPSSPVAEIEALKAEKEVPDLEHLESKVSWITNVVQMLKEANSRNCGDPKSFRIHWRDCTFKMYDHTGAKQLWKFSEINRRDPILDKIDPLTPILSEI